MSRISRPLTVYTGGATARITGKRPLASVGTKWSSIEPRSRGRPQTKTDDHEMKPANALPNSLSAYERPKFRFVWRKLKSQESER